jgi:hypothetical protein
LPRTPRAELSTNRLALTAPHEAVAAPAQLKISMVTVYRVLLRSLEGEEPKMLRDRL